MLISICLCTYKRAHLIKTLESINALTIPDNTEIEVIVIDNDEGKYAESIVFGKSDNYRHRLTYINQPIKNISIARNEYLKAAKGEYIASLDDDEIVDKEWLVNLLNTAVKYKASVVFGQVKPIYPNHTPNWIVQGRFFDRKVRETGTEVSSGGAGCTLIRKEALLKTGYTFDAKFGKTGGEDSDLFYRLHKKGFKLVYCKEAFVSEEVEPERLNCKYLFKRAIRIGQTFSRYRFTLIGFTVSKCLYISKAILKMFIYAFLSVCALPFGKATYITYVLKMLDNFGKCYFFATNDDLVELYK